VIGLEGQLKEQTPEILGTFQIRDIKATLKAEFKELLELTHRVEKLHVSADNILVKMEDGK
jgi:iron-sulfur cluster repair protein YtfE (RIC family)